MKRREIRVPTIGMRTLTFCEKEGCMREGQFCMSGRRDPMVFYACSKHFEDVMLQGEIRDTDEG